ncbi:hypothetical protein BJ138DRAFT_1164490 [Hygrophoropsis aurantiaca]|uniref:Uncharacterized protein n=1 Tax=Hygrophoropsis aurantiaca TaxID=72124 RepID=A0ACB7ZX12_9AGAM|nr:hypothetical protein BJ138DRAFT_1164490 [Hygrophoropsis aurantiaca]
MCNLELTQLCLLLSLSYVPSGTHPRHMGLMIPIPQIETRLMTKSSIVPLARIPRPPHTSRIPDSPGSSQFSILLHDAIR